MVAIAILVAALAIGLTEAHFKCNRNVQNATHKNQILDLGKLLSLESVCMDICEQSKCDVLGGAGGLLGGLLGGSGGNPVGGLLGGSGGGPLGGVGSGLLRRRRCANGECSESSTQAATQATTQSGNGGEDGGNGGSTTPSGTGTTQSGNGGDNGATGSPCSQGNGPCSHGSGSGSGSALGDVLGAASCLIPGGNPSKVSPYQACLFPCILNLNLLDTCDVQAIITHITQLCPKVDLKGVCVSACLCCGKEGETVDACVNLCLSSHGIDLNLSPLKVLGLGGDDAVACAPEIDGFQLPGLPLLPQLGLDGGASAGGSVGTGSGSGSGSCTTCTGTTGSGSSGSGTTGSGSNSGATTASSNGEITTGAAAGVTTPSGNGGENGGEATTPCAETTPTA